MLHKSLLVCQGTALSWQDMSPKHYFFECPALEHVLHVRRRHGQIYTDSRCSRTTMRILMGHRDQKAVASCLLPLFSEYAGLCDVLLT